MSRPTADELLVILRSASSVAPDPRLNGVLEAFRGQWLAIARARYPALGDDVEDAVQTALVKLVTPARLDGLREPTKIEAWARSIFVNSVLDLVRGERLLGRGRVRPEPADLGRLPSSAPGPEEEVAGRERLRIVAHCLEGLDVARLRFVDGIPEKEIAVRRGLSRDAVAGQLKRLRQRLRRALGEEG